MNHPGLNLGMDTKQKDEKTEVTKLDQLQNLQHIATDVSKRRENHTTLCLKEQSEKAQKAQQIALSKRLLVVSLCNDLLSTKTKHELNDNWVKNQ